MESNKFFKKLPRWSRRKHRLLDKYLRPFTAKVAAATQDREIFCIDGFAGAASYEDGSDGSPLLMAHFSDECGAWSRPVSFKMINVEPDEQGTGIFEALEIATREWQQKGTVRNLKMEFHAALPEVIREIRNCPALFFIDPFGPTYLHFEHLLSILNRTQKITELIINFDQDGLRRIVDAAFSGKSNAKAAETNIQNITKIIGSATWKDLVFDKNLSSTECEAILLREYTKNLSSYGYYVVAYPIRESIDTKPKYHFVYCTRHRDGLTLMNDFVREEEDLIYGEHVEDKLPLFQDEASLFREIQLREEMLRPIVRDFYVTHGSSTRNKLIDELVLKHFGMFHSKNFRAIHKELRDSGELKTSDDNTKIDDRIYQYFPK